MGYRLVERKDRKPLIVFPRRGEPPAEAPLSGYERDPGDPYTFRPKECVHFYVVCVQQKCCKAHEHHCVLHGAIEVSRCNTCKDKKLE